MSRPPGWVLLPNDAGGSYVWADSVRHVEMGHGAHTQVYVQGCGFAVTSLTAEEVIDVLEVAILAQEREDDDHSVERARRMHP